jgi:hypothetical protein
MSGTVGPTSWWLRTKEATDYYARICPAGTVLPDGSAIYRRAGGQAWIVSPMCTQASQQWAGGCYNNTSTTTIGKLICCVCEWPGAGGLCNCLIANGFNPCEWFVPDTNTLYIAYQCAVAGCWGGFNTYSQSSCYWTSVDADSPSDTVASFVWFVNGTFTAFAAKSGFNCVRAIRCINY